MTERPDVATPPATEITQWSIVEVDGANHLVGVLLGGHPRLPAGHWIITSPIVEINEAEAIAITASTGRIYRLREHLSDALPIEAHKLIACAPRVDTFADHIRFNMRCTRCGIRGKVALDPMPAISENDGYR